MSLGFGLSAGDFIAALNFIKDVVDALRESGSAGAEYRELMGELYSLETALLEVKRLDIDATQHAQLVALQQAASQCQRTIDDFWQKLRKFHSHLRAEGSTSRTKDGWRKVQWALCKKEDLVRIKAQLRGHTGRINVLLMTMQMSVQSYSTIAAAWLISDRNASALRERKQEDRHLSILAQLQENSCRYLGVMTTITKGVSALMIFPA